MNLEEIKTRLIALEGDIMLLKRIILGDEQLGIAPMNERLLSIDNKLDVIEGARKRDKNILTGISIGLGLNVVGIGGILIKLFVP